MTLHERQILAGAIGERVADQDRLVALLDFPLVIEVAIGALDPGRLRRREFRLDAERFAAQRQFQRRPGQLSSADRKPCARVPARSTGQRAGRGRPLRLRFHRRADLQADVGHDQRAMDRRDDACSRSISRLSPARSKSLTRNSKWQSFAPLPQGIHGMLCRARRSRGRNRR